MADKIIPELQEATTFDSSAWFVFDSGIQSWKISVQNYKRALSKNTIYSNASGSMNLIQEDSGKTFLIQASPGVAVNPKFILPAAASFGMGVITIKDLSGNLSLPNSSAEIIPALAETIEGLTDLYPLRADFGSWNLYCDGTRWFFI